MYAIPNFNLLVGERQPQGRFAVLYVCVRKCVTSCMRVRGGGQEDGNSAKGKRGLIRGNVYSIVVSRVYSRGEIETTGADSASVVSKLCG